MKREKSIKRTPIFPESVVALLDIVAVLDLKVLGRHEDVAHELVAVLEDVVQGVAARPALILSTFKLRTWVKKFLSLVATNSRNLSGTP